MEKDTTVTIRTGNDSPEWNAVQIEKLQSKMIKHRDWIDWLFAISIAEGIAIIYLLFLK